MRAIGLLVLAGLLLAGRCEDLPPSVPLVIGPVQAWPVCPLQFQVQATDPDGDDVEFLFGWGDGDSSGWSEPMMSGIWRTIEHSYADTGRFTVRARARAGRLESDWSAGHELAVHEFGPLDPARPVKLGRDTVPVGDTVGWMTRCGHPLEEPVAFQFDWGDTVGEWSKSFPAGEWVTLRHLYSSGGTFVARVRGRDGREHLSDWSAPGTVWVLDSFQRAAARRGQ